MDFQINQPRSQATILGTISTFQGTVQLGAEPEDDDDDDDVDDDDNDGGHGVATVQPKCWTSLDDKLGT